MKTGTIYTGIQVKTLEGNSLARLFTELTSEGVWSNDYTVSVQISPPSEYLEIARQDFSCPLRIYRDGASTVRGVEDAVREHLRHSIEQMRDRVGVLQNKIGLLKGLRDEINHAKARAAIVDVFPEATDLELLDTSSELYAFTSETADTRYVYVAREVNNDFVYGVVRHSCEASVWLSWKDGLRAGSKLEMFFIALARRHAAERLGVPENEFQNPQLEAFEKPPEEWQGKPGFDPYVVNGAIFQTKRGRAVVVFVNNLPIGSVSVTPTATIV